MAARLVRRWIGTGARSGPDSPPQARRPGPIHIRSDRPGWAMTLCGVRLTGAAWRQVPERPQGDRGMCRRCLRNEVENHQDPPKGSRT